MCSSRRRSFFRWTYGPWTPDMYLYRVYDNGSFTLAVSGMASPYTLHEAKVTKTVSPFAFQSREPKLTRNRVVRILFMVPVYTIACLISIPLYKQHIYFAAVYEFYESLVIASFFLLLCLCLDEDLDQLKGALKLFTPKPWILPIRFFRIHVWRRKTANTGDGLRWFHVSTSFCYCLTSHQPLIQV